MCSVSGGQSPPTSLVAYNRSLVESSIHCTLAADFVFTTSSNCLGHRSEQDTTTVVRTAGAILVLIGRSLELVENSVISPMASAYR